MSNNPSKLPGLGVMLKTLGGSEAESTVSAIKAVIGKLIKKVELRDNSAVLTFEDGDVLTVLDDGQSCCEHRYMVCDDKLDEFKGAKLVDVTVKDAPDAPDIEDSDEAHEVQFLEFSTDRGAIQFANHNEHNGYYGGFYIVARRSTTLCPGGAA